MSFRHWPLTLPLYIALCCSVSATVIANPSVETTAQTEAAAQPLFVDYAPMPDYTAQFSSIESARNDKARFKQRLLAFYSALLPALRYRAFNDETSESAVAYNTAESASFELARLYLMNPTSIGEDEFAFLENVVIDDGYTTAKELVNNILPRLLAVTTSDQGEDQ